MAHLKTFTDASWSQDVGATTGLVLVDLWAPWCGPCKAMLPTVMEIAEEYASELSVGKLNIDENPQVAGGLGVRSIPTLVLYRDGAELGRVVGGVSKTTMATFIEKHL